MSRKVKKRKDKNPFEDKNKRAERVTILVIFLILMIGLIIGYLMFSSLQE